MNNNFWQKKIEQENQNNDFVVDLKALFNKEEKEEKKALKKTEEKKDDYSNYGSNILKPSFLERRNSFFNKKIIKLPKIKIRKIEFKNFFTYQKRKNNFSKIISQREKILLSKMAEFKAPLLKKITRKRKETKRRMFIIPGFAIVLIVMVILLKLLSFFNSFNIKKMQEVISNNSYMGVNNLLAATDSFSRLDFKNANHDFSAASLSFLEAEKELGKINENLLSLASFSNDPKIKLASQGRKFLSAGLTSSSLGKNLTIATDSLFSGADDFSQSFSTFIDHISLAINDAKKLGLILESINPEDLPEDYALKFEDLMKRSSFLFDNLDRFLSLANKMEDFLGVSSDKRYLLVFQNNTEIRASGGFMGSYALLDLRDGRIRNLEVPAGGTYDLEAGLKGKKFASPYPLHLVNSLWNFWDANWWPDWPKTAKHLMWFYEQSSGPSVDAVISLTPTVIERVLAITGPIDMTQEYGLIIDSDNFWETVQKVVEYKNLELTHPEAISDLSPVSEPMSFSLPISQDLENNSDNKPKKIIGDLMAKLIEVLPEKINQENLPAILSLLIDSTQEKQVLFYFKDEKSQEEIKKFGLAGEMKSSDHDYLMIVDTNIAGQKTDRVMKKNFSLSSEVNDKGEIINNLIINRQHEGIKREALVGVRNVNWLRVYVPLGSKLISASGFSLPDQHYFDEEDPEAKLLPELENEAKAEIDEPSKTLIYEEEGRTVFANWTMTDPGENTEIKITYVLPFNFYNLSKEKNDSWLRSFYRYLNPQAPIIFPYSFLLQKQPGAKAFPFSFSFKMPNDFEVFWQPEDYLIFSNQYLFQSSGILNRDHFYGSLVKKIN